MKRQGPLIVTASWDETFKGLCSPRTTDGTDTIVSGENSRVIAVVGPKGAGKSTFAKELFERWTKRRGQRASKVAFLDTDLGRPEFTLPGLVSLHVADKIEKSGEVVPRMLGAVFIGEDDPAQRPEDYLKAIGRLAQLIQASAFDVVVVNTHGWFSGLAQDVLEAILVSVMVTDVVQIVPEQKMATLGSLLRRSDQFKIWTLAPAKDSRQRESKPARDRRIVDYFCAGTSMYCVGLGQVRIRYPNDVIDRNLPPNYALLAVNASLVGLSRQDDEDPEHFLGFGLVCSVDTQKQCLFILSSLSSETIKECKVVTVGTSAHVPLHLMPGSFQPGDEDAPDELDAEVATDDEDGNGTRFLPYLTMCKMIGYGSAAQQRGGVLKRRRLEGGGGEA